MKHLELFKRGIYMDLQESLELIRKNSEQMSWSGCGNCSRRKFYQTGYEDGLKESEKELQELREYKSKVEKFVLRNKNIFLKIPVCQFVEILEKELEYKEER